MTALLEPDRDQLEVFIEAMFRHVKSKERGFVSLRSFYDDGGNKSFRITPTSLAGGLRFLMDVAEDDARRAANEPKRVVFCPPVAVFGNRDHARAEDLIEAPALSVECDQNPQQARAGLEAILGPATLVVRSGGVWTNPATGEPEDKLPRHRTPEI